MMPKFPTLAARGSVVSLVLLCCCLIRVSGDPTACDGNASTVPNCCVGEGKTCDRCEAGYGLVKGTCQKCQNPKCAYCNGNTKTCKASDMYVGDIPHCSGKDWTSCYEVCVVVTWFFVLVHGNMFT